MKKKLIVLVISAAVLMSMMTGEAGAADGNYPKEYLATRRLAYENSSWSFTFDVDANFSREGMASAVVSNLQMRNPQAWASLSARAWVTRVVKKSDMVVVEIEAESAGRAKKFSSVYGKPVEWLDAGGSDTRLEFKDTISFPFEKYPDLARIESFEADSTPSQASAQEQLPLPDFADVMEHGSGTFLNYVSGDIKIRKASGEVLEAKAGSELEVGDRIETGADGKAVIVVHRSSIMRLKPDSVLVIPPDPSNTREKVGFIQMIRGVLWARAKKDENSLKVATPNAVCGVRGTEFEISHKDGNTCVKVSEGKVWLSAGEGAAEKIVAAGEAACIP